MKSHGTEIKKVAWDAAVALTVGDVAQILLPYLQRVADAPKDYAQGVSEAPNQPEQKKDSANAGRVHRALQREDSTPLNTLQCDHEWYQGICIHCELTAKEFRAERFFLSQDNSSHWYVVPVSRSSDWQKWTSLNEDDTASWEPPKFAAAVGGSPSIITFQSWKVFSWEENK